MEQWFVDCNKIADLRYEFDATVCPLGLGLEQLEIDGKDNARCSLMPNDAIRWTKAESLAGRAAKIATGIGIHALDNREAVAADVRQNGDRTQQSRGVIDQVKECCE